VERSLAALGRLAKPEVMGSSSPRELAQDGATLAMPFGLRDWSSELDCLVDRL
jgi:hypothetical protein